MKNSLFKNFSWNFLGSLIYALSQWAIIIIIAQFGSPNEAGIYTLGLAISAPLIMFINLKFRALQSTDLSVEYGFNTFRTVRILGILFFMVMFFIILMLGSYSLEITIVFILIALNKITESFSDLYYGLFQYNEKLDLVAKSTIFRGVVGTFAFGIFYSIFGDLKIALISMLLIWILNLLTYDIKKSKKFLPVSSNEVQYNKVLSLMKIGFPLGLVALIASLNVNFPRILIEKYLTIEDLGYFATIFYMVLIIGKFMTSISSAIMPRMARLYANGEKKSFLKILYAIILLLSIFSFVIIIISFLLGSEILKLIYGSDYSNFQTLLVLVMFYGFFNYLGFSFEVALNAMKAYQYRFSIEISVTGLIIITSIYLIPQMGLNGAALALIISSILKLALLIVLFLSNFFYKQRSVSD